MRKALRSPSQGLSRGLKMYLPPENTLRCKLFPFSKFTIHLFPKVAGHSIMKPTTNWKLKGRLEMKRYEYMTVDLSAEPSFNVHVKLDRYIAKLNEYGKQGWRLISGTDDWKYSIFEREIEDKED